MRTAVVILGEACIDLQYDKLTGDLALTCYKIREQKKVRHVCSVILNWACVRLHGDWMKCGEKPPLDAIESLKKTGIWNLLTLSKFC